jgi:hypothetical protein
MSAAALEVYQTIKTKGTQKSVIGKMQTRNDLYKILVRLVTWSSATCASHFPLLCSQPLIVDITQDYHKYESALDQMFSKNAARNSAV